MMEEQLKALGVKIDEFGYGGLAELECWRERFNKRETGGRLLVLLGNRAGDVAGLIEGYDSDHYEHIGRYPFESSTVLPGGAGELFALNADFGVGEAWKDWAAALEEIERPIRPRWWILFTESSDLDLPPGVENLAVKISLTSLEEEEVAEVGS